MKVPTILQTISKELASQHARAVLVGGAVRDHFLASAVKDYDIEVFGLHTLEQLHTLLSGYGHTNLVGRHFGIVKLVHRGREYDFSFPRRESKNGAGHRGFVVATDGSMSFEEAAARRDFSCNAMGYDIETGEWLDPFGGRGDMAAGILRHIHSHTFVEDPLRVYRAVQFAARFGWRIAEETMQLCREMVAEGMLEELPRERIYQEWQKLLLNAPRPSVGFMLMRELGITARYFPELHALIGTPQSPRWHPEGDVWTHTMMTLDKMAEICRSGRIHPDNPEQQLKLLFAALCHDLGKPAATTVEVDGRIRSIGHEHAGVAPCRSLLYRLTEAHDFITSLLPLVEHHLKPSQFYVQGAKSAAIRRLSTAVTIEELVLLAEADFLGRSTAEAKRGIYEAGAWLLEQAKALQVEGAPPQPLVRGRDLIRSGLQPSPAFGKILEKLYHMQLEGSIKDRESGITALHKIIKDDK